MELGQQGNRKTGNYIADFLYQIICHAQLAKESKSCPEEQLLTLATTAVANASVLPCNEYGAVHVIYG